jgi:hypothetical protein
MPRSARFEVVCDTSLFNALQLQPSTAMSLGLNGLAHWMKQHWVSYPKLIAEHHFGVVFLGVKLEYEQPLGFFDADVLTVESRMCVMRAGTRLRLDVGIHALDRRAVRLEMLMCPVAITEPVTLGSEPAPLPAPLLAHFQPDEHEAQNPQRTLPALLQRIREVGRRIGGTTVPFQVHRHLCEPADQWYFGAIPGVVEPAREALALSTTPDDSNAALRRLVGRPMRSCELELSRPYYWRHGGQTQSEVYELDGEAYVVHHLLSTSPTREAHGVVIERF